jgi:hypothetical protein
MLYFYYEANLLADLEKLLDEVGVDLTGPYAAGVS